MLFPVDHVVFGLSLPPVLSVCTLVGVCDFEGVCVCVRACTFVCALRIPLGSKSVVIAFVSAGLCTNKRQTSAGA